MVADLAYAISFEKSKLRLQQRIVKSFQMVALDRSLPDLSDDEDVFFLYQPSVWSSHLSKNCEVSVADYTDDSKWGDFLTKVTLSQ